MDILDVPFDEADAGFLDFLAEDVESVLNAVSETEPLGSNFLAETLSGPRPGRAPRETKKAACAPIPSMPKAEDGGDEDNKDPKKERRLIRNRMSAQLHRERKKAYIDKLEAEVKDRDGTIGVLGHRIDGLIAENVKLRELLAHNGIAAVESILPFVQLATHIPVEMSDPDTAAHDGESSDESSEGTRTPPLPVSKKRGATVASAPAQKSARVAPGSMLAAFALLMFFRSPLQTLSPVAPVPAGLELDSTPVSLVPRGGRVLMTVPDESSAAYSAAEDEEATALRIIPQSKESKVQSVASPPLPLPSTNSSYLFCPAAVSSLEDVVTWANAFPGRLNSSESAQKQHRRRAEQYRRGQSRQQSTAPLLRGAEQAVVPRYTSNVQMHAATSLQIAKLLLARPHDENATKSDVQAGSLVVRDPSKTFESHSGRAEVKAESDPYPPLMLLVPSSSLDGFASFGSNSWVEIGCRMHSARFVDFQ
jgi:hypothetical protein